MNSQEQIKETGTRQENALSVNRYSLIESFKRKSFEINVSPVVKEKGRRVHKKTRRKTLPVTYPVGATHPSYLPFLPACSYPSPLEAPYKILPLFLRTRKFSQKFVQDPPLWPQPPPPEGDPGDSKPLECKESVPASRLPCYTTSASLTHAININRESSQE